MSVAVGPFLVAQRGPKRSDPVREPTARQVRRVQRAVAALDDDVPVRTLLKRDVTILFGWVDYLPGTKSRAAGYAVSPVRALVRDGLDDAPDLTAEATIYVVLHEALGHCNLMQQIPSDAWQSRALRLLDAGVPLPPYADPDQVWRQAPGDREIAAKLGVIPYWLRPYECLIDDMVAALADGLTASWSKKYRRHVTDLGSLKKLWLEPRASSPALPPDLEEPSPVDPLPPEPEAPDCDDLEKAVAALTLQLSDERQAHDVSRARLAKAKAKGAEIAAL